MSGRRFARRNLFSKLLAWLLSFHFQFSLQGEKKIITLNNNLQKKRKGFVVPTQMKMRRLDWTEVGAALHKTWARNTDETQNHTCLAFFLQKTKQNSVLSNHLIWIHDAKYTDVWNEGLTAGQSWTFDWKL